LARDINTKQKQIQLRSFMNCTSVGKFTLIAGIAGLITVTAQAQFTSGKLAVLRVGDNGTNQNVDTSPSDLDGAHQSPVFIDEFDPVTPITISITNIGTNGPIYSVPIPTNDPAVGYGAMWINGHAGTEGYLAQSDDRATVAFSGYGGNILASNGTPSQISVPRGLCVIDIAGSNYISYESLSANPGWYDYLGAQINPRGAVSDDGTNNFWGSGSSPDGNEYLNVPSGNPPVSVQDEISTRAVKFINGSFYTSLQAGDGGVLYPPGIYDYATIGSEGGVGSPVALPEGDVFTLNLVVPASASFPNVEGFDMNPQVNIAYMADNTYGIAKYVKVGANWVLACAFAVTNNTSTGPVTFPTSYTGFFGLAVDWSGSYPVIFGTTTEGNGGFANSNRLIRIDDNFNYTNGQTYTNLSFTVLATAWGDNVAFRGLSFGPDRRPTIQTEPANESVVTGSPASFTVGATTVSPFTYEWLVNGVDDPTQTNATYSVASAATSGTYQVIVSNNFGTVTSMVATLTVTASPVAPSLISPVPALNLTNAINDTITIPVTASGTDPLSYAWWFNNGSSVTNLTDGGDFSGSATGTLTINVSSTADTGSYYVVISNATTQTTSNLVATVAIVTPQPVIFTEPANSFVDSNKSTTLSVSAYPIGFNCTFQWYQITTNGLTNMLSDNGNFVNSQSDTLGINNAQLSDAGGYFVVVSDGGGSVTSSVATLEVLTPAPYSYVSYTPGLVYAQDFDSLPDPGVNDAATGGVGTDSPNTIDGVTYFVSNPFDFAAPLNVGGTGMGGLALSNTMMGWYSSDSGNEEIQAFCGDNTTGLICSFGCTNAVATNIYTTNNRALGMIASPATSNNCVFALRLQNTSSQTMTSMNLSYVSELWRNTLTTNFMTNYFYVDPFATNTTPTNNWTGGLTNLSFGTNIGTSKSFTKVFGTNAPLALTNMTFLNVPLNTPWTPGAMLWIVWEMPTAESGAQGIGIDNLVFTAGGTGLQIQPAGADVLISWPAMFANAVLQANTTTLNNQAGWMNVTNTPSVTNGLNYVTLPASQNAEYFRLSN
jgi:hypothetical protein